MLLLKDASLHPIQEILQKYLPELKDFRNKVIKTFSTEEKERFWKVLDKRRKREYQKNICVKYIRPVITSKPYVNLSFAALCEIVEMHKNGTSYDEIINVLLKMKYFKQKWHYKHRTVNNLLHKVYPQYLKYNEELVLKKKVIELHKARVAYKEKHIDTRIVRIILYLREKKTPYHKINQIIFEKYNKRIQSFQYKNKKIEHIEKRDQIIKQRNEAYKELVALVQKNKRKVYKCPYCQEGNC